LESSQIQTDNGQGLQIKKLMSAPQILWLSVDRDPSNGNPEYNVQNEIELEISGSGPQQKKNCRYQLKAIVHNPDSDEEMKYGTYGICYPA